MLSKVEQTERWVRFGSDKGIYLIQPVQEDIIRCVYTVLDEIQKNSMLVHSFNDRIPEWLLEETDDFWIVKTEKLDVMLHKEKEYLVYKDKTGKLLLKENGREAERKPIIHYTTNGEKPEIERVKTIDGERNFVRNLRKEEAGIASKARIHFSLKEEEGIFGFGQAEEGVLDYRYVDHYLYQHNMRTPMPFFISTEGYGMFIDCGSVMTWHGGKEDSYLFLDTVYQADTYFIAGNCMDDIIRKYRRLTGKAVMLPRWSFGYIQSKEMYHSAEELLDIVKEYRKRQIPLDCVVQDWKSWSPEHWGEKCLDPERYGNIEEKFRELHELHAHAMVSVWPTAAEGTRDYKQFLEQGYLLNDCSTYNAFDENARALYWEQAREGLFSKGFDAWWCDSTEPFSGKDWCGEMKREPWERYFIVSEEHKQFISPEKSNLYALVHAKGIYENQRKTTEEKRVVNLTRSGYAGSQKYGAILWSGDISATWETMKKQIVEGIQMGMSGYPYWTLDIGGFFTVKENWKHRGCDNSSNPNMLWFWHGDYEEGIEDYAYRELYTRWLAFGTFLPVFRSHGTDTPREIWRFGEPGTMFYDAIAKFIKLRYCLMPYIYSMAADVHFNDSVMMRSLLFDFANDHKVRTVEDGYMFGKSLLIYPVTEPMYYDRGNRILEKERKKKCYLPNGCGWYNFWTNEFYEGGQVVEVDVPIDQIPVFVKEGSILPMVDEIMYADEVQEKMLKIRVYTGKDASFSYYEDSGDGYGYEKNQYCITTFVYDHKSGKLQVKDRVGDYPQKKELCYEVQMINRDCMNEKNIN